MNERSRTSPGERDRPSDECAVMNDTPDLVPLDRGAWLQLGAVALFAAACIGTGFAFLMWIGLCQDGTSVACLEGHPVDWHLIAQVIAAVVGLIFAGLMLREADRRRWRPAASLLGLALVAYALGAMWLLAV
jgi:Ca2+/Na+ antiporter